MEALGPWHILIVAAVFVVLFGAKRLPDAARSLGKSARILKSELKDATGDHPEPTTRPTAEHAAAQGIAAPVQGPAEAPPVVPEQLAGSNHVRS